MFARKLAATGTLTVASLTRPDAFAAVLVGFGVVIGVSLIRNQTEPRQVVNS